MTANSVWKTASEKALPVVYTLADAENFQIPTVFWGENAKSQETMISHHEIVAAVASLFAVLTRFMPSLTVYGGNL